MIVKIACNNPNLLDILNKNPNTDEGLYLKPLANGVLIGNCISAHQYDVIFQDYKYSFTNLTSNLLDFKSYCDGRVVLKILSEFFNHLLSYPIDEKIKWLDKTYSEVDTAECNFHIENLWIDSNYVKNNQFFLSKYFDGFVLTAKGKNIYSLSYCGKTVLETFNVIALTIFLVQMSTDEPLFLDEGLLKKYIRILGNTPQAPYFIYYLLGKKLGDKFAHLIPSLEDAYKKTHFAEVKFTPNDTQTDRIEFVKKHLDFNNVIVDFGCGSFDYFKRLCRFIKTPYYGYDKDDYTELYEKLKSDRYKDKEWYFVQDYGKIEHEKSLSVILSEVIEHNTLDEAEWLIRDFIITHKNTKQVVVSTPNISFNKYYHLDTLRHEDHLAELTEDEFKEFINKTFKYFGEACKSINFYRIGDTVGEICTTLGAVIWIN